MPAGDEGGDDGSSFLSTLQRRAGKRERTLVFPEGDDPRVRDAVATCAQRGLFRSTVLTSPASWDLESISGGPESIELVDPADPAVVERTLAFLEERRSGKRDSAERLRAMAGDPLFQAGALVQSGDADGAVAGCVRTTADVVRAGLVCIGLADGIRTVSSSFYMVFEEEHRVGPLVLTFTDAGVVPRPNADQLGQIAVSAVGARELVVGDEPRVAFLSYSTRGSAEGASVTLAREALEIFRAHRPDVVADGELQGDAALVPAVAMRKAPDSPVAGQANVLVFPDLAAANVAYKLVQHLGGATALGPVLQGLARPFSDLSRGAAAADIVSVACITSLMAE